MKETPITLLEIEMRLRKFTSKWKISALVIFESYKTNKEINDAIYNVECMSQVH